MIGAEASLGRQLFEPDVAAKRSLDIVQHALEPSRIERRGLFRRAPAVNRIVPQEVRGKRDLNPEEAKMFSAGIVVQPFRNVSANLDWWEVVRTGTIQSFGATDLLRNYDVFQDRFFRRSDGTIAGDAYARFFKLLFAANLALAALFSARLIEQERVPPAEYGALLLLASTGMMLAASAVDLLVLYLANPIPTRVLALVGGALTVLDDDFMAREGIGDFRDVALWAPTVLTDGAGRGEVRLRIAPASATRHPPHARIPAGSRMIAFAVHDTGMQRGVEGDAGQGGNVLQRLLERLELTRGEPLDAELGNRLALIQHEPEGLELRAGNVAVAVECIDDISRRSVEPLIVDDLSRTEGAEIERDERPALVGRLRKGLDGPRDLPDSGEALAAILDEHSVFGRVTPHQKLAMVGALQSRGHVVAMTGDGVNDVLALKDADIGVAMGSGSSASRAVAQLVLLDGNFASMPPVVGEGRRVIANIERVANLFVVKTVYAFLLAVLVGIFGQPFPFVPRHLTLVGTLTIGAPAFFLALAPSAERARPGFIPRVLRFAIPVSRA